MKWLSIISVLLLVSVIPVDVGAYKILMIPVHGSSHIFSILAVAEGLADKRHNVCLFIGKNYPLDLPVGLRNRSEFSVVRYRDQPPGMRLDYNAETDNLRKATIESGSSMAGERSPAIRKMYQYVYLFFYLL